MWPFRRRRVGKHALGAAVTAIPSALPSAPTQPVPSLPEQVAPVPVPVPAPVPAPPAAAPAPVAVPPAVPDPPRGPRVELGFRDGSTAALAPGSEQAKALTDIASVLTKRD